MNTSETQRPLKICMIASELLGWGKAGGYGFATRNIARGLVKQGHHVTVTLPCPRDKSPEQFKLDGFQVVAYSRKKMFQAGSIFAEINADIYHSQEPSPASFLAQRAMPNKIHLITSRDPRDWHDWWTELKYPTFSWLRVLPTIAVYQNPVTYLAVRRADQVFVPAHCLKQKTQAKYQLRITPEFLPTPIELPQSIQKSEKPSVCFVGRLDRRKRPERFLELAAQFPDISFKVAGNSQDPCYERQLHERYDHYNNIEFLGFIDQFSDSRLTTLLNKSWIMVNTSAREGLPNSFIEAAGHGCAIVSELDPDNFTSRFGALVDNSDYASALRSLLQANKWQTLGEAGRAYVQATNEPTIAIAQHIKYFYANMAKQQSMQSSLITSQKRHGPNIQTRN